MILKGLWHEMGAARVVWSEVVGRGGVGDRDENWFIMGQEDVFNSQYYFLKINGYLADCEPQIPLKRRSLARRIHFCNVKKHNQYFLHVGRKNISCNKTNATSPKCTSPIALFHVNIIWMFRMACLFYGIAPFKSFRNSKLGSPEE